MEIKSSTLFAFVAAVFVQTVGVSAIPPRPLAIPRPNVGNAPPAPGDRPNLRDLGSELIQGGIEQFASAAFAPDTSIFATSPLATRTTARSTTLSNAFDVSRTTARGEFDVWASTTSNAFNVWPPEASTVNAFDIGWSTTTPALFPRATATASHAAFVPSCPRAELYIDYCAAWYGDDWSTATIQAYCLCYGPASTSTVQDSSAPTSLVWVPDLFDRDAQDCHSAYSEAIHYWSDIYSGDSEYAGDPRVKAAWNESIFLTEAWGEADTFCNVAGNDLGASVVDPTYYEAQVVGTDAATAKEEPSVSPLVAAAARWQEVHLLAVICSLVMSITLFL